MDNTQLIAALEGATGPDQVLEQHIAEAIGWRFVKEGHPIGCVWYDAGGRARALPAFTASIDAALTLVPEGWETAIYLGGENVCVQMETEAMRQAIYFEPLEAIAATPALAICIAALKARP